MRNVWQRYDALATDGDTGSASASARVFTILVSALLRRATSHPTLLGVPAQMHGVRIPASNTLHSHRNSDSVADGGDGCQRDGDTTRSRPISHALLLSDGTLPPSLLSHSRLFPCLDDGVTLAAHSLATLLNVVGMISTEVGLSMQTAPMKMQWCVSPTNIMPTSCQLFISSSFC
jgi:hypothetical protein